jgi:hypothetical protein
LLESADDPPLHARSNSANVARAVTFISVERWQIVDGVHVARRNDAVHDTSHA